MKIGIIDLLADSPDVGWLGRLYGIYVRSQFASIAPQAVSVWCRQLGHQVTYTTYYGQRDPLRLLPDDLDVLFVATYSQASALAYALAKIFRRRKTLTVIGGPHAKSFPTDCTRFFDLVVKDCDKSLIGDILSGQFDPPTIITSNKALTDFPLVVERWPEISTASFPRGRPVRSSVVPLLSSIGCPYSCDFCVDWSNPYVALPKDRLKADLEYLSKNWPTLAIAYHDPNFAVRFGETMDVIEGLPEGRRNPYIMESSLSILKESRLHRLRATNCAYVAPGIESWNDYSAKSGTTRSSGREKLEQVVDHLTLIAQYVPGIQTNFVFGTDQDRGAEPAELTKEFVRRTPFVWPIFNIPTPFGGTPLYDAYHGEGRILDQMPFALYYNPYLAITLKHYHPIEYYDHMIDLQFSNVAGSLQMRRILSATTHPTVKFIMALRTMRSRRDLRVYQLLRQAIASDPQMRAFHEGKRVGLPRFYDAIVERRLGRYAEILSKAERVPQLESPAARPSQFPGARATQPNTPSQDILESIRL